MRLYASSLFADIAIGTFFKRTKSLVCFTTCSKCLMKCQIHFILSSDWVVTVMIKLAYNATSSLVPRIKSYTTFLWLDCSPARAFIATWTWIASLRHSGSKHLVKSNRWLTLSVPAVSTRTTLIRINWCFITVVSFRTWRTVTDSSTSCHISVSSSWTGHLSAGSGSSGTVMTFSTVTSWIDWSF